MANGVRVKVHRKAVNEIMTSPAAKQLVRRKAGAVARAANAESSWGGYRVAGLDDDVRARAIVYNISWRGIRDEARNNRMIRQLDEARDA